MVMLLFFVCTSDDGSLMMVVVDGCLVVAVIFYGDLLVFMCTLGDGSLMLVTHGRYVEFIHVIHTFMSTLKCSNIDNRQTMSHIIARLSQVLDTYE